MSTDGGATWQHGRNVFFVEDSDGERTRLEPPPLGYYRALEHAPRVPPDDLEGTYPCLTLAQDRAIISFRCFETGIVDSALPGGSGPGSTAPGGVAGKRLAACVSVGLPISWFY